MKLGKIIYVALEIVPLVVAIFKRKKKGKKDAPADSK
jgi:hypothetical protein